jgi:hypothetical protein
MRPEVVAALKELGWFDHAIRPMTDQAADFAFYWPLYSKESGANGEPVTSWLTSREWLVNRLHRGDRVWLFIGGSACGDIERPHRAYVAELLVVDGWGDFKGYKPGVKDSPRFHIRGIKDRGILVDPPALVDSIFRRPGTDPQQHIGLARQTPFQLGGRQVAKLLALLRERRPEVYAVAMGESNEPQHRLPEKVLRAIRERRGQADFRGKLLSAYGRRCAITACDAEAALEAAHIRGYAETGSQDVTDGLLLRADIHTLFDFDLVRIDPKTLRVAVAPELRGTCYRELQGRKLRVPDLPEERPSLEALRGRWEGTE